MPQLAIVLLSSLTTQLNNFASGLPKIETLTERPNIRSVCIFCLIDMISHFVGGKELAVKLILLWKQNVHIEYTATAVSLIKVFNPLPIFAVNKSKNMNF